jgi:hypothetical protein
MQKQVEEMLKKTAIEMKRPLLIQLESFTTAFQKELLTIRQDTHQQLESMQKQTLAEVSLYKEQKLREVESTIMTFSKEVAREVLGAEIDTEKHEELVFKALQEAKKQKIF